MRVLRPRGGEPAQKPKLSRRIKIHTLNNGLDLQIPSLQQRAKGLSEVSRTKTDKRNRITRSQCNSPGIIGILRVYHQEELLSRLEIMHPLNRTGRQITKSMAEKRNAVDIILSSLWTRKNRQGVRFSNAFCASKQCQRVILTSRNVHPLEKIRILRSLFREKFEEREVKLQDQFETKRTRVIKPLELCNPAKKNEEGVEDPTAHLTCYQIKDVKKQGKFVKHGVIVRNQFGETQPFSVIAPLTLCAPSEKNRIPSALQLDHYKCYAVKIPRRASKFEEKGVRLEDQFETKETKVIKPVALCTPVNKKEEGILDERNHLTCYQIKDVRRQNGFEKQSVSVHNQFGDGSLDIVKPDTLCVPSEKTDLGPLRETD
jgi:hypothetical protein